MSDSAADVIADALTHHRPQTHVAINLRVGAVPNQCTCGAHNLSYGDRWEVHLADVVTAALTQAGMLGVQPVTYHVDHTAETRWRAAALAIVATATAQPVAGIDAATVQRDFLRDTWPTLAADIERLIKAKADLLKEHP